MAYKKRGGCQPITAKLKYTTKGGVVDPLLNLGSPAKMKMHSPAKVTNPKKPLEVGSEFAKQKFYGKYYKPPTPSHPSASDAFPAAKPKAKKSTKSSGNLGTSMTPTSVENGKGKIHGPKVSYDMAYKNRDMKTYGKMSKSEYIAEAKRQTKSFKDTGKWNAPKPRKKQTSVVAAPETKTVSIETKKPTATVEVKVAKTAKPTKTQTRKAKSIDKKLAKAKAAREAGNIKKAERKEKRAARKQARISKRAAKKNSPAAKKGCYSK